MNNQLTDPKAPVTDEELDQMIWKLERDGMTPKLLSLMRELREVRRVNSEKLNQPVSETERTHPNSFTDAELEMMSHGDNPQANAYRELLAFRRNSPVTPDGWVMVPEEPTHEMLEAGDAQFGTYDVYRRMIEAAPKEVK